MYKGQACLYTDPGPDFDDKYCFNDKYGVFEYNARLRAHINYTNKLHKFCMYRTLCLNSIEHDYESDRDRER